MPPEPSLDGANQPFYPPKDLLTESPARRPPSHDSPSNTGWRQTPPTARRSGVTHISYPRLGLFHGSTPERDRHSTPNRTFNRDELLSPAPPPPANLHTPHDATAFSVDPGVPFLATAGPTEDGSEDEDREQLRNMPASMRPGPGPKNLVGGLVSGIRTVVRRSTTRRRREGREGREAGGSDGDEAYTPQYDDAPAPTPAQPTPASLYAQQIQQQDRERRAPVSPIARDFVAGANPSPHRLHPPTPRIVIDPDGDDEADFHPVPFTYTPPDLPAQHQQRRYTLHDAPTPSRLPQYPPNSARSRPVLDADLLSPPPNQPNQPANNNNEGTPPIASPVSATPHYAPDYAQMNLPTSGMITTWGGRYGYGFGGAAGLKVYARKVRRGWDAWRRMPWVMGLEEYDGSDDEAGNAEGRDGKPGKKKKENRQGVEEENWDEEEDWRKRVTWDYYPQRPRRRIGRLGVKDGKGGVWKDEDEKKEDQDDWDDDDTEDGRKPRVRVPAIMWRSAHYRVSLDESAMPFEHDHHRRHQRASQRDGDGDEDGDWDTDAHGHPEGGSHYRGQDGHQSDPEGWMDIRPLQPRRNVVITPQRRSNAHLHLDDEFEAVTPAPVAAGNTPLPLDPPMPPHLATPPPPPGGSGPMPARPLAPPSGPLPMYPPGQTPVVPSGPMPYYPPTPARAPANAGQRTSGTPASEPPPIVPIEDGSPPARDRSRAFPPPLLPHPHLRSTVPPLAPLAPTSPTPHAPETKTPTSASPIWSRPPPGQPPGTYAPMPPGFDDAAARRMRSQSGHATQHSPTHSRAGSQRSAHSRISAASRPPPGQPPGTYIPPRAFPPPGAIQRDGSAAYAPSARSHASTHRSRPPPGQPPGTYPPFDDDNISNGEHMPAHQREPAYGYGYTPSGASSTRPRFPPPPGQPLGTYMPQAHISHTPSHASHRSHISGVSHASSNPFRPPPGQPPGTYPPFIPPDGDEDEEEEYDSYTPTPAPRVGGVAAVASAPSAGARSHISSRSHRLLQTPGPASARSLAAARELTGDDDEDEDEDEHEAAQGHPNDPGGIRGIEGGGFYVNVNHPGLASGPQFAFNPQYTSGHTHGWPSPRPEEQHWEMDSNGELVALRHPHDGGSEPEYDDSQPTGLTFRQELERRGRIIEE